MAFKNFIQRWMKRLTKHADAWWFGAFLGFLCAADAYVVFVPNEAILMAAVMAKPEKWISFTVWTVIGSAAGAVSVAMLLSYGGEDILHLFLSDKLMHSRGWKTSLDAIRDNGLWGLTIVSLSPLPQHAAVIIAGLVKMKPWDVAIAVVIGRGIKYGAFAYLAVKAPSKLRKWKLLPKV